jgi:hypothetical protein
MRRSSAITSLIDREKKELPAILVVENLKGQQSDQSVEEISDYLLDANVDQTRADPKMNANDFSKLIEKFIKHNQLSKMDAALLNYSSNVNVQEYTQVNKGNNLAKYSD